MRPLIWACAAAVSLAAVPLHAAELLPAKLSIYLDPVFDADGSVLRSLDNRIIEVPLTGPRFSDKFSGILGASATNTGGELTYDIGLSGEIFPFVQGSIAFQDTGAPSGLFVTFSLPIPAISGPANYVLGGSIENQSRLETVKILSGETHYFKGSVNNTAVATLGTDPVLPLTAIMFSSSGMLDCATFAGGACNQISGSFAATGPGGGSKVIAQFKFDVDAVTAVPLPASLPLLAGGIAGLALARRRRRPV